MQAVILRKNIFSESSEIITFFSQESGKVQGVARSVKSPKSKLAFGLQPLFLVNVELVKTRKIFNITGVRVISAFKNLRDSIKAVNAALYATELLLKSTADEQPHPELFDFYLAFLKHLDSDPDAIHACADFFAFHSLGMLGYQVNPKKCALCGKNLAQEQQTAFSNRKGGFVCSLCMIKVADAQKVSSQLQKTWSDTKPDDFERQDAAGISNSELHGLAMSFASFIIERDLKSGRFVV